MEHDIKLNQKNLNNSNMSVNGPELLGTKFLATMTDNESQLTGGPYQCKSKWIGSFKMAATM